MPNVLGVLGSICLPSKSPSTVCLLQPLCVREMRAESQCEGKRGHCFPEGRLAERAINYRRQADRQTNRQGSQADRQADGTAESADRPDRTGAGPTHTKERRRSAAQPLKRTNERKKKIHTHTTTTVPSPKRVRSSSCISDRLWINSSSPEKK